MYQRRANTNFSIYAQVAKICSCNGQKWLGERMDSVLLKLGKLILSHEKPYMTTVDDVPERFPVKIAFTRKLNDDEMMQPLN